MLINGTYKNLIKTVKAAIFGKIAKNIVTDVRYSMIPNQISPMWGLIIDVQRGINEHAIWWTSRSLDQSQLDLFKEMLSGKKCRNRS